MIILCCNPEVKSVSDSVEMKIIAKYHCDFPTKFGLPRQSSLATKLHGKIVFEEDFRNPDCLRGLEGYSHLWLLWNFSESEKDGWSPTVRPPKLGGNKRMGVFATRSPFRPNPIGLSCVKIEKIELTTDVGPVIYVSSADLMDNTPIFDIKPYLAYADSFPDALSGFSLQKNDGILTVEFSDELQSKIPPKLLPALIESLRHDPRPGYQNDPQRIYYMRYSHFDIGFRVDGDVLTVTEIRDI